MCSGNPQILAWRAERDEQEAWSRGVDHPNDARRSLCASAAQRVASTRQRCAGRGSAPAASQPRRRQPLRRRRAGRCCGRCRLRAGSTRRRARCPSCARGRLPLRRETHTSGMPSATARSARLNVSRNSGFCAAMLRKSRLTVAIWWQRGDSRKRSIRAIAVGRSSWSTCVPANSTRERSTPARRPVAEQLRAQ